MRLDKLQNQTTSAFRLSVGVSILLTPVVIFSLIHIAWRHARTGPSAHASLEAGILNHTTPHEEKGVSAAESLEAKLRRESNLESGDIIFRRGVSLESRAIIAMDGDFGYSHAGIIRKTGSRIEVIHASYAEEGQTQEIIINEPVGKFLKPSSASSVAVYRLNAPDKSLPLIALSEAERFLNAKISFDKDFDLATADRIYCTELIWLSFKKAGIDLTAGRFDRVPYLLGNPNKDYILPSSLLNSSQLQKVWASQ
jgi:hypothetical protein